MATFYAIHVYMFMYTVMYTYAKAYKHDRCIDAAIDSLRTPVGPMRPSKHRSVTMQRINSLRASRLAGSQHAICKAVIDQWPSPFGGWAGCVKHPIVGKGTKLDKRQIRALDTRRKEAAVPRDKNWDHA